VLNWLARNAVPSPARNAIVLANIVGFGCVTATDVWGVFSGDARPIAKAFLVVHLLFTLAFVAAARAARRGTAGGLP
jgi:aspartokinase